MNYYLNPEPQLITDALIYYADSPIFEKVTARDPMAMFFSEVYKVNLNKTREAFNRLDATTGSLNAKTIFLNAMWIMDKTEGRILIKEAQVKWRDDFIAKMTKAFQENTPPKFLDKKPQSPAELDILWSIFFANGNEKAVQLIISALEYQKNYEKTKNQAYLVLVGAAQWSLTSNAKEHKRVYQICEREMARTSGVVGDLLKKILSEAKPK